MQEVSGGAVLSTARRIQAAGLNRGTAGNISARSADGFVITPSGLDCHVATAADMVAVRMDGHCEPQAYAPSSEWRIHRDLYAQRPEIGAVIHTHAPFATALACLRRSIPAFHYMIARFGGADVRCAAYATFGEQALSDQVLAALQGRLACLMANHGMLVVGRNLEQAEALAIEFEALCEQYWRACQLGEPVVLHDEEMQRVLDKFAHYGQPARAGAFKIEDALP